MNSLGRLERVDLRTVWQREAGDFTPWLAQQENLILLGDVIGLELDLDATEKNVGPFRADIVCKDTTTDHLVLIENQLERTDHSHLGQLLTYAAGLEAVTIVWIAENIIDEHRAALDWLNEVTNSGINFFGLEIELWRIGNSQIAPKFNVVSQPNDWTKTLVSSRRVAGGELTSTKQLQLEFWQAFREHLRENKSFLKSQKPLPQHWTNFAIGRSGFHLTASVNTRENLISVSLIIGGDDAKPHFYLLTQEKEQIETEIGCELEWRELTNRITSDIGLHSHNFNLQNRLTWATRHTWLQQTLEAFHRSFSPRVRVLNSEKYIPADDVIDQDEEI